MHRRDQRVAVYVAENHATVELKGPNHPHARILQQSYTEAIVRKQGFPTAIWPKCRSILASGGVTPPPKQHSILGADMFADVVEVFPSTSPTRVITDATLTHLDELPRLM